MDVYKLDFVSKLVLYHQNWVRSADKKMILLNIIEVNVTS